MSDCNETLREMYVFLDGEIPPHLDDAIRAHLGGCLDCLGAFEFHHELKALIARKCRDDVPSGLAERIVQCFGDDADDIASPGMGLAGA